MANSYSLTTASPGQNTVAIPFDYVSQLHVSLEVNGVATPFVWNSASVLGLLTPLAGGERVFAFRSTPDAQPVVTYSPGTITSKNLNDQTQQLLFVVQEAADTADASISINFGTNTFDAQNLRVVNLATPISANDAVNKAYADTIIATATQIVSDGSNSITALIAAGTTAIGGIISDATTDLNGLVTAADAVFLGYLSQSNSDRLATAADRVQTGLDRVQTGSDVVQTGLDRAATAAALAAAGLPAVPVTLNYLRRNAGNTAYEVRTPAQVATDLSVPRYDALAALTVAQQQQHAENVGMGKLLIGTTRLTVAAADIVFVANMGDYVDISLEGLIISTVGGGSPLLQFSKNAGAAWLSAASAYVGEYGYFAGGGSAAGALGSTGAALSGISIPAANPFKLNAEVTDFNKPTSSFFDGTTTFNNGTSYIAMFVGGQTNPGVTDGAAAYNALRIYSNVGTLAAGTYVSVYGRKG